MAAAPIPVIAQGEGKGGRGIEREERRKKKGRTEKSGVSTGSDDNNKRNSPTAPNTHFGKNEDSKLEVVSKKEERKRTYC